MKKKLAIVLILVGLCISFSPAQVKRSLVMNGSFEQNGYVIDDILIEQPFHWCDVNIPSNAFECWVGSDWWTHSLDPNSGFSLSLETRLMEDIFLGEMVGFSQQVYVEDDVANLSFDLRLSGIGAGSGWDPQQRMAVVLIDGFAVWDSNELELDSQNEFEDTVIIDSNDFNDFLDNDLHTLTLGLMSLVDDSFPYRIFTADWDFVKFDKYCGGLGYLASDFSQDCYVDFADFALLAQYWLLEGPPEKYDVYEDNQVNDLDLMLFAEEWLFNSDWTKWGREETWQMELLDLDLDLSGQVDEGELVMLEENWLQDVSACTVLDQDPAEDGVVNLKDFAVFAEQWRYKDWIYYLD